MPVIRSRKPVESNSYSVRGGRDIEAFLTEELYREPVRACNSESYLIV